MQLLIKFGIGIHVKFFTVDLLSVAISQSYCSRVLFYFITDFGKNTYMMSTYINMAPFYASIFSVK